MKLSIRLQNHGCKNHPLWWIVIAPNRKNIKGRFIEHVGYWNPLVYYGGRRQAIMNLNRIKYWIGCGAVPTFRIHKLLNQYGILPRPWYYVKTQEELAKQQVPQEELDDKKKRKIEKKEKKKLMELIPPRNQVRQVTIPLTHQRSYNRRLKDIRNIILAQEQQNDMLRSILLQNDFSKMKMISKLATVEDTASLKQMQASLKKIQQELAYLEKNTLSLHPVKKSMLMEKINELIPKIYQLEREQEQEIQNSEAPVQETLLRRKVMHEVMIKRLKVITKEIETYYRMLQPLSKQSYTEYLVNDLGLKYDEALEQANADFDDYEEAGIPALKGDLFQKYNLNQFQHDQEDLELNPIFFEDAEKDMFDFSQVAGTDQGEGQPIGEAQGAATQFPAFTQDMSEEQILATIKRQMDYNEKSQEKFMRNTQLQDELLQEKIPSLRNPQDLYDMIMERRVILPVGNPVNPYPDLKSYIPQEYYDLPERHQGVVIQHTPAFFPEQELLKYREKIRSHQQHRGSSRS